MWNWGSTGSEAVFLTMASLLQLLFDFWSRHKTEDHSGAVIGCIGQVVLSASSSLPSALMEECAGTCLLSTELTASSTE